MPAAQGQTTGTFTFHYINSSLKAGQQYSFRVCSYRDEAHQQTSDYSNEAMATMPGETSGPSNKIGRMPTLKRKP
jgi:hypothetical protein